MKSGRNTVGTLTTFLSRWVSLLLAFVSTAVRARVLGPDDLGAVVWLLLVPVMAGSFVSLGLGGSITYSARSLGRPLSQLLSTGILAGAILGALASGVLALLIGVGAFPSQGADTRSLVLMLLVVPIILWDRYLNAALLTLRLFVAYNSLLITNAVLNLVLTTVLVWWAGMGVFGAVSAFVLVQMATLMGATAVLVANGCRPSRPLTHGLRGFMSYGLRSHFGTIVQKFNLRLDQLLLGILFPASALAWYSISVRIAETLNSVPDSIGVVLFPSITGADRKWAAQATAWLLRVAVALVTAGAGVIAIVAPYLVPLIFGHEFQASVMPLLVALPGALFLAISKIATKYLDGIGRPGISSMSMLAGLVVGGLALVPMTRAWGLVGAAVASDLGYFAIAAITLWWFMRLSSTSLKDCLIPRAGDATEVLRRLSQARSSFQRPQSPTQTDGHQETT